MSLFAISDAALPGLGLVAEPGLFLPALSGALNVARRNPGLPVSMEIIRIRHRRGERAVIHAEFGFQSNDVPKLPASIWLHAGGRAKRRAAKAAAGGAVHEPMSDALVYFFPSDPHIPGIAAFVSDPRLYASELFAGRDAPAGLPRLARYRPGISAAFWWADEGRPGAYVKIQKESDAPGHAALLDAMRKAGAGTEFSVPRPLGASPRINGLAMEEVRGVTLGEALASAPPSGALALGERALRALKVLHERGPAPIERRDRTWLVRRAQSTASRITGTEPGCAAGALALAGRIASTHAPLAERPAHCDIKLEHIVFSGQKTVLLDLDSFALADPLCDLAMLDMRAAAAAQTGALSPAARDAVREAARRAARTGYGADAGARLAWLKACAAMQLAGHFAQNAQPGSAAFCRFALETGEAALNAAGPSLLSSIPPTGAMISAQRASSMEW